MLLNSNRRAAMGGALFLRVVGVVLVVQPTG
jgi:hypothetical protein